MQTTIADAWVVESYPSGSTVITSRGTGKPWLYLYGPRPVGPKDSEGDDPQADSIRYRMCEDVAACLNGGCRPRWLGDMERVSEAKIEGTDGSSIVAIGPTRKDPDHPNGWDYREDREAKDMQARLIDRLWFAKGVPCR